jgi:choline kinase
MILITLAAGNGIRMGKQGILTPKTLLPLAKNTTILDTQHKVAKQLVATKHIIVAGKHINKISNHCQNNSHPDCQIIFNPWYHSPSPLFSLICSIPTIALHDVIIANGDTAYSREVAKKISQHSHHSGIYLYFSQVNTNNPTDMKVVLAPNGAVHKAHTPDSKSNFVSTGLVVVKGIFYRLAFILGIIGAVIQYWLGKRGYWHQVFNGILSQLQLTKAIKISKKTWFEVDTPGDLIAMRKHVATYF